MKTTQAFWSYRKRIWMVAARSYRRTGEPILGSTLYAFALYALLSVSVGG